MKKILSILSISLLLFSCSNDKDNEAVIPNATVSVSVNNIEFQSDGTPIDANTVTVTSSDDWTLIGNSSWVTASTTSGKTNGEITFTVESANTTLDARTALFHVVSGNESCDITLKQGPKPEVQILGDSDTYDVVADASAVTIQIKSNVDFTYQISEEAKDWITFYNGPSKSPVTKGVSEKWLTFDIAENTTFAERQGTITLKINEEEDKVFTIGQAMNYGIVLDQNEFEIDPPGGNVNLSFKANVPVTIDGIDKYAWLTPDADLSKTTGEDYDTYSISFTLSSSTALRLGELTVKSTDDTHTTTPKSVLIHQAATNPVYMNITDGGFSNALVSQNYAILIDGTQYELTEDAINATSLNFDGYGVGSFEGIDIFTNLDSLSCSPARSSSIDLSALSNLTYANLDGSNWETITLGDIPVKSLSFSEFSGLHDNGNMWWGFSETVTITGSQLENVTAPYAFNIDTIDLSGCPSLKTVDVANGKYPAYYAPSYAPVKNLILPLSIKETVNVQTIDGYTNVTYK